MQKRKYGVNVMVDMRMAYQWHHLSVKAKKKAEKENKGHLLSQYLYNKDGSRFENSTRVDLYKA